MSEFESVLSSPSTIPSFPEVTPAFGRDPHVAAEGGLAHEGHQGEAEKGQGHEEGPRQIGNGQGLGQRLRAQFEELLLVGPDSKARRV